MPTTSIFVLAAIVTVFVSLATVLAWAERQTRRLGSETPGAVETRRRPF